MTWLIGRTSQLNFCTLYSDSNVSVNLLAELTERSFNLYNVTGENTMENFRNVITGMLEGVGKILYENAKLSSPSRFDIFRRL